MKKLLLILLVFLVSCSKDDITEEFIIESLKEQSETIEETNSSDEEVKPDFDEDGIPDEEDDDDDNDGVVDTDDIFPNNPNESSDNDGDGIGDNEDTDDDNDEVNDEDDAFPFDPNESVDTDGDGIGDNEDLDDNGNGINDDIEYIPGIKQNYTLYKESVLNQRSGIAFTWHDQQNLYDYTTSMNISGGWFNAYQAYHDVNNDGYMDILVSYHTDENNVGLYWYINSGDDKNFNKSTDYINQSTQGMSAHKLLKTDVNNDDIVDFVALGVDERVPGDYSGNFTVLIGKSDGTFDVNNLDNSEKLWFHNGAAGDLNGDGFVDVIAATYLWWGDGTGGFTKGKSVDIHDIGYTESPLVYEIIDINKDGWNDLILRGPFENTKVVLNNSGTFNSSNEIITLPEATYDAVMDIEIVDFDNDGDYDIIELAQLGGNPPHSQDPKYFVSNLLVYYNNNLNFQVNETILNESIDGNYMNGDYDKYGWSVFKFDDIDNDGQDEIIAENYHDSNFNALKLIDGTWKKTTIKFGN